MKVLNANLIIPRLPLSAPTERQIAEMDTEQVQGAPVQSQGCKIVAKE